MGRNWVDQPLVRAAWLALAVYLATSLSTAAARPGGFHPGEAVIYLAALWYGPIYGVVAAGLGTGAAMFNTALTSWGVLFTVIKVVEAGLIGSLASPDSPRQTVTAAALAVLWAVPATAIAMFFLFGAGVMQGSILLEAVRGLTAMAAAGLFVYWRTA
ncbi:MAG: ECF transporter S component [Thermaerobacterales bacterium]